MKNKVRKQEFYTSPEVKVVEIKAQKVVCVSYGSSAPDQMVWCDDNGSNWN